MLLGLTERFGFTPIDLGRVPDNRETLRATLDRGAAKADVILTSGGASSGDEDHVSALLNETGAMSQWRIAVKPGRPLALGLWKGTPVFGLPEIRSPHLSARSSSPAPLWDFCRVRAGTARRASLCPRPSKSKKPGRREYLRARVTDGQAEVFKSEGSGRISGLSWAEGLVELPDHAVTISPGDPVSYIPFASFL